MLGTLILEVTRTQVLLWTQRCWFTGDRDMVVLFGGDKDSSGGDKDTNVTLGTAGLVGR